jgi:hypothetical protein
MHARLRPINDDWSGQKAIHSELALSADIDLAIGDAGHGELHRRPTLVAGVSGMAAVPELGSNVRGVVGRAVPQDRYC